MAMAASMLAGVASAGTAASTASVRPIAETRTKTTRSGVEKTMRRRSGIEHGSRATSVRHRVCYASEVSSARASESGRDGRPCSSAACPSGTSGWPVVLRSGNATRIGWSASGLLRLDLSGLAVRRRQIRTRRSPQLRINAEKVDLANVAGTLLRIGRQGLEAGTKLIPESVPRPVAQAGVGLAGAMVASYLLRTLFSTAFFILAIGAVSYAVYLFLSKGESGSSSGNGDSRGSSGKTDDALEEARKIMDKYK